jgi:hypothetical protein
MTLVVVADITEGEMVKSHENDNYGKPFLRRRKHRHLSAGFDEAAKNVIAFTGRREK